MMRHDNKSMNEQSIIMSIANALSLFNPRTEKWSSHFKFSEDFTTIMGLTASGRATVALLKMNNERVVKARSGWRKLGWNPPID